MNASANASDLRNREVLLYGYYGCGNVGDDLLLAVLIDRLAGSASKVRVKCLLAPGKSSDTKPSCTGGIEDESQGGNPAAICSNPEGAESHSQGLRGYPGSSHTKQPCPEGAASCYQTGLDPQVSFLELEQILADRSRFAPVRLGAFLTQIWRALRGARVLMFGGGTLFHATGGSPTNLLILTAVVLLARLRGAQVAAIGVGVAEVRGRVPRALLSIILLLSSDFAVRDSSSLENCRGMGGSGKVRQTADLVFLYPLPTRARAAHKHPTVGLALAASAIGDNPGPQLAPVSMFVDLLHQRQWDVFGVSFQELDFKGHRLSDSALLQTMRGNRPAIPMQRLEPSGDGIADVFSALDVVVGMRFHALVLAARLGIPFVGVGRDAKLADLCRRYGLPFFEIESLIPDELMAAVEQVRGSVPNPQVTTELANKAAKNFAHFDHIIS